MNHFSVPLWDIKNLQNMSKSTAHIKQMPEGWSFTHNGSVKSGMLYNQQKQLRLNRDMLPQNQLNTFGAFVLQPFINKALLQKGSFSMRFALPLKIIPYLINIYLKISLKT